MDVSALCTVSETGVSTVTNLISSTSSVHKNGVNPPVGLCPTRSSRTVRLTSAEEWPSRDRITRLYRV